MTPRQMQLIAASNATYKQTLSWLQTRNNTAHIRSNH